MNRIQARWCLAVALGVMLAVRGWSAPLPQGLSEAEQQNWALEHLPITGDWVLCLDADEYLTEELIAEI